VRRSFPGWPPSTRTEICRCEGPRWSDLPADSHPLIDTLVARRLLVKDDLDGEVVVEVALESLLRQWDELAGWLRAEADDLKAADSVEQAARLWNHSGRQEDWLLEGTRLADAEALAQAERRAKVEAQNHARRWRAGPGCCGPCWCSSPWSR
jgi:hypothetical protein